MKDGYLNICFLLEHKSYIDHKVREQIERYMSLMWDKQAQQAQARGEKFRRLPIVPIVFYHGEAHWEMGKLPYGFEHFPPEFHRFIPHFDIIFLNLQDYTENRILSMGLGLLENAFLLFKNCKDENALLEKVELLWRNFKEFYEQNEQFRDFIKASIQYFLQNFESNSKNQSLAMDRVQNYFATPAAPVRTLYDVIMDEAELRGEKRGVQIGESRGIQIGESRGIYIGRIEILQATIGSMWEHRLPMSQIALFSRLTIEEVQDFMRKIVGEDNMQNIELQWNKGLSIEDIAKNTNMEIPFIQRIVDYVLDYKTEDDNKIAQA